VVIPRLKTSFWQWIGGNGGWGTPPGRASRFHRTFKVWTSRALHCNQSRKSCTWARERGLYYSRIQPRGLGLLEDGKGEAVKQSGIGSKGPAFFPAKRKKKKGDEVGDARSVLGVVLTLFGGGDSWLAVAKERKRVNRQNLSTQNPM